MGAFLPMVLLAQTEATTTAGKKVFLLEDGTWKYATADSLPIPLVSYAKPVSANDLVKGKDVLYKQYFDHSAWLKEKITNDEAKEYAFTRKNAFVYAMVIPEKVQLSMLQLRSAALDNALAATPDMRIVYEEKCLVNSIPCEKVIMKGTLKESAFTYYCLYYAGKNEVVQVITYCASEDFEQYRKDMDGFLNGFTLITD
jgi:hypothetical protein